MSSTHHPETDDADQLDIDTRPSKSQKKRESHALQDLGGQLVGLSAAQLARIEMSDSLRSAIREAQRITSNGAKRRQMQYIGRLMRDADPAPIRAALDALAGVNAAETARQHRLERLRERLLEDESALTEVGAAHPGADLTRLRQLRRTALKERDEGRPPRAYRELFRQLRELDDE